MQLTVIGTKTSEIKEAIQTISKKGVDVSFYNSNEDALSNIRAGNGADMLLVEIYFDIATLIKTLANAKINTPIVAFGINSTTQEAVSALKAGAREFIPLPPDEKLISAIIESIIESKNNLIFNSKAMKDVISIADKVASSNAHILITGQSGVGKEVLANYIHNNSKRCGEKFIRVNCAAIPENLIESELFGYEKGAFTGAISRRVGKFEESSGGTLLLDEISEMDARLQAKLLRAIQEKEIDRIGGSNTIKVDLRIIATSNRNLESEIESGSFREDLYYRLNVINIEIPPLIERREDIDSMSRFFIEKYCQNNHFDTKELSNGALKKLVQHNWPGNIRELENVIHRAVLLSESIIESDNIVFNKISNLNSKGVMDLTNQIKELNSAANIIGASINNLEKKLSTTDC